MSFNLDAVKAKLLEKGITIHSNATSVVAGLVWWVEGIEKAPRYGDLLFYVVNGTRYGVRPTKSAKHDIEWYYDQLKTGMKGAKGYSSGLTQFLNTWVKKGELEIVFKGKVKSSEIGASVTAMSMDEKLKIDFDRFKKEVESITFFGKKPFEAKANEYDAYYDGPVFYITMRNVRYIRIKCNSEENTNALIEKLSAFNKNEDRVLNYDPGMQEPNIDFDDGSEGGCIYFKEKLTKVNLDNTLTKLKKDCKALETMINSCKCIQVVSVTAASPRKYRTSIRERMDRDSYLDPMDYDTKFRKDIEKFNKFKKEVQDIEVCGKKPFYVWCDIDTEPNDDDWTIYAFVEFRNGSIRIDCDNIEKERLDETLFKLNEKYGFKILDYPRALTFTFGEGDKRHTDMFSIPISADLTNTTKMLKQECALINKILEPFSNVKVIASPQLVGETAIRNLIYDKGFKSKKQGNDDKMYWELEKKGKKILTIGYFESSGLAYVEYKGKIFDKISTVKDLENRLDKCLDSYSVTASSTYKEGEEGINQFIKDVNNLTIHGNKVFNAERTSDGIKVNLKINKYETPDMNRLDEIVQDRLHILFPLTKNWLEVDRGSTFGNNAKVGDIYMYTEDWTPSQFSKNLVIEDCSKIDWKNLSDELYLIYKELEKDCKQLENTNVFKVAAAYCPTKDMIKKVEKAFKQFDTPYYDKLINDLSVIEGVRGKGIAINISAEDGVDLEKFKKAADKLSSIVSKLFPKSEYDIKEEMDDSKDALGINVTRKSNVCEVLETLGDVNEENFEGINKEHDRLMYMKVSPESFINLWKTSTKFNPNQINKIVFGFKLASRTLGSKFEKSGIKIEYFFKKQDGKGYIRVEYGKDLFIIYVSQSDKNGDIKVVTKKMRKVIPVKNFNLLSTSVDSLTFENATLPPNFKKVWEEVSKD